MLSMNDLADFASKASAMFLLLATFSFLAESHEQKQTAMQMMMIPK
jgi:hypothetical protein